MDVQDLGRRFVHFAFGLLAVPVASEVFRRHAGVSRRLALILSVGFVIAVGALYEIFEWLLALFLAGSAADEYNGQQGDQWDAQKDMALAALGALLVVLLVLIGGRRKRT